MSPVAWVVAGLALLGVGSLVVASRRVKQQGFQRVRFAGVRGANPVGVLTASRSQVARAFGQPDVFVGDEGKKHRQLVFTGPGGPCLIEQDPQDAQDHWLVSASPSSIESFPAWIKWEIEEAS